MTLTEGATVQDNPFGKMREHAFLERPQYAGTLDFDRCGYRGVNREHHGEPSDAVVRGGEALRKLLPGVFKDGGGVWAVQDSQRAAAAVIEAVNG